MEDIWDIVHSVDLLDIRNMLDIVDMIDMVAMMDMLDMVISLKLRFTLKNTESRQVCFLISLCLWILVKDCKIFVLNNFANSRIILQNEKGMFTTHILQNFCLPSVTVTYITVLYSISEIKYILIILFVVRKQL